MVGEMCSPNMQAQVMSYLALGDAMGNILGKQPEGLSTGKRRASSPY